MARTPLRYQLYVVVGILLFTAAFGACSIGIRAIGTPLHAMPACVRACGARHAEAVDVDIRMGKRDHSVCVCSDGERLPSPEADTVGVLSFAVTAVFAIAVQVGGLLLLRRRAKARAAT